MNSSKVYVGADHAGFRLKEIVINELHNEGYKIEDLSKKYEKGDDYPDVAFKVAEKVASNRGSKGILICGTGAGMCIAANKVKGIRASVLFDKYSTLMSREHNDCNIACLRARKFFFSKEKKLIKLWLKTNFEKKERHQRRIDKIKVYEK